MAELLHDYVASADAIYNFIRCYSDKLADEKCHRPRSSDGDGACCSYSNTVAHAFPRHGASAAAGSEARAMCNIGMCVRTSAETMLVYKEDCGIEDYIDTPVA